MWQFSTFSSLRRNPTIFNMIHCLLSLRGDRLSASSQSHETCASKCQSLRLGNPSLYKKLNNRLLQTENSNVVGFHKTKASFHDTKLGALLYRYQILLPSKTSPMLGFQSICKGYKNRILAC